MANDELIRRHMIVSGRVQGVSFRYYTVRKATELGLTGWVRNRVDGSVEIEVQGQEAAVAALVAWAGRGPRYARVVRVAVSDLAPYLAETDFQVRR